MPDSERLGYFFDADPHVQEQMHRLHVLATMRLSHAALANLIPRATAGTGIINVSSVAAYGASPQNVSYCATKTWMNRFTEGLAIELGAKSSPVTVQALCPGFTLTEFQDTMGMKRSRDSRIAVDARGFRRGGEPARFRPPQAVCRSGVALQIARVDLKVIPSGLIRSRSIRAAQRYKQPKNS